MTSRVKARLILSFFFLLIILFTVLIYNQYPISPKTFFVPPPTPTVTNSPAQTNYEKAQVLRVIDGDTIELTDKRRVRYIGINTPESVDPKRPLQCFGAASSEKNKELVEGKTVYLEKDISNTDRFGRLLRYVYLDNPNINKNALFQETSPSRSDEQSGTKNHGINSNGFLFVNEYLVKTGYAKVSTFPPDVKYKDIFLNAERYARENNLGLWGKCL